MPKKKPAPKKTAKKTPKKPAPSPLAEELVGQAVLLMITMRAELDVRAACMATGEDGLGVDAPTADRLIDEARRRITLAADYHRDVELGRAIERHNQLYEMAVSQNDPNAGRAIERERCRLLDLYPRLHDQPGHHEGTNEADLELERILGYLLPLHLAPDGTPAAELVRLAVERTLGG